MQRGVQARFADLVVACCPCPPPLITPRVSSRSNFSTECDVGFGRRQQAYTCERCPTASANAVGLFFVLILLCGVAVVFVWSTIRDAAKNDFGSLLVKLALSGVLGFSFRFSLLLVGFCLGFSVSLFLSPTPALPLRVAPRVSRPHTLPHGAGPTQRGGPDDELRLCWLHAELA